MFLRYIVTSIGVFRIMMGIQLPLFIYSSLSEFKIEVEFIAGFLFSLFILIFAWIEAERINAIYPLVRMRNHQKFIHLMYAYVLLFIYAVMGAYTLVSDFNTTNIYQLELTLLLVGLACIPRFFILKVLKKKAIERENCPHYQKLKSLS